MEKQNVEKLKRIILPNSTLASYSIPSTESVKQAIEDFWFGTKTEERLNEGLLGFAKIEKRLEDIEPTVRTLNDKNGDKVVMIYAIPQVLETSNSEVYFIGNYPLDAKKYDKRVDSMPIDEYFARKRIIPKEFLVGALTSNWGHESEIIKGVLVDYKPETLSPNTHYYGVKQEKERKKFADHLVEEMKSMEIELKTVEETEHHRQLMEMLNLDTYYIDQLDEYQKRSK